MDIEELEEALRHINGQLISTREMHYIYRVSDRSRGSQTLHNNRTAYLIEWNITRKDILWICQQ